MELTRGRFRTVIPQSKPAIVYYQLSNLSQEPSEAGDLPDERHSVGYRRENDRLFPGRCRVDNRFPVSYGFPKRHHRGPFAGTGTALPQGYNLSGRGSTVSPCRVPTPIKKSLRSRRLLKSNLFRRAERPRENAKSGSPGKVHPLAYSHYARGGLPRFPKKYVWRHKVAGKITR